VICLASIDIIAIYKLDPLRRSSSASRAIDRRNKNSPNGSFLHRRGSIPPKAIPPADCKWMCARLSRNLRGTRSSNE